MAQKYKNNSNSAQLDQFYTKPSVAKVIVDGVLKVIDFNNRKLFLEPSAGNGSFSNLIINKYNCVCFDIDPKQEYIIKKDFFTIENRDIGNYESNEVCVIGNPPFGKNSSLAVKFFNHCAKFADTICFVVPRTFKKQSIRNRLNLNFKLKRSIDLPKDSFIYNEKSYDVPCVFQIWQRSEVKRKILKSKNKCKLFRFVNKEEADFAVRRAGGRAGTAFLEYKDLSIQSNHFCKVVGNRSATKIVKLINNINLVKIASATAGVRSISKGELIRAVERKIISVSKKKS